MRCHHSNRCKCRRPSCCRNRCHQRPNREEIVYPTEERVIHRCSDEVVRHVKPIHTTIVNERNIRNEFVYPETFSEVESVHSYDVGRRGRGSNPSHVLGTNQSSRDWDTHRRRGCHRSHCRCRRRKRCF